MRTVAYLLVGVFVLTGCRPGAKSPAIAEGSSVKFNYTLTVDGQVVESSEGREPLAYVQGSHAIVQGLEDELLGLRAGDKKTITVAPEKGYGALDPQAVQKVPKTLFSNPDSLRIGGVVRGQAGERSFAARVTDLGPDYVMLDFNHPLAGKTLVFDITVTEVTNAPKPSGG